jgi:hypothetical protein
MVGVAGPRIKQRPQIKYGTEYRTAGCRPQAGTWHPQRLAFNDILNDFVRVPKGNDVHNSSPQPWGIAVSASEVIGYGARCFFSSAINPVQTSRSNSQQNWQ